jgi:hypothetical protein
LAQSFDRVQNSLCFRGFAKNEANNWHFLARVICDRASSAFHHIVKQLYGNGKRGGILQEAQDVSTTFLSASGE